LRRLQQAADVLADLLGGHDDEWAQLAARR
jgi:hypothetical protein